MEELYMKRQQRANEWLQRAKSNMARAKAGRVTAEILYEDLCYDAQQAAEKALKALCILHEILFPRTHDIAYLMDLLVKESVLIPEDLYNTRILTAYAVETRYPGDYEPVNEDDYLNAIVLAEKLVKWVEARISEYANDVG
jgi:HEPN domain-containing protein